MNNNSKDHFAAIVAADDRQKYICHSEGFEYVPDSLRHEYGKSTRKPLEDMLVSEIDFFRARYPGYEIFTLGSSAVLGERFVMYLTVCEFTLETEDAFHKLTHALRESDQAIRRKLGALWKWDMAGRKGLDIAFMVGHFDFAYFLQHRREFREHAHTRYMSSFITEQTTITSHDFKVLHDGQILPFDESKLDEHDARVYRDVNKIRFAYEEA